MRFSLSNPDDKVGKPPATNRDQATQNNAQASSSRSLSIFKGFNILTKPLKSNQVSCTHEKRAHKGAIPPISGGLELPVELWLEILEHILIPQVVLVGDASYHHIQSFYVALTLHSSTNPAQTRAKLRLVCRAWKLAVDHIDTQNSNPDGAIKTWIKGFEIHKAAKYGPCTQLDTCLENFSGLRDVHPETRYQHAVSVIRLHFECLDHQMYNRCPDLTYLLVKPWTLSALHISFISCRPNTLFPNELLQNLPSLCTLSIASNGLFRLAGSFTLPSLTTLFITFWPCSSHSTLYELGEWRFPNLHSLSVDARQWPLSANVSPIPIGDELGLGAFLRKHRETLRSIRMIPFLPISFWSNDAANTDPSLTLELPVLETLVTDFVQKSPWEYYNGRIRWLSLPRINHLFHISTGVCDQESFATRLLESLQLLPTVEIVSISITEECFANKGAHYTQNKRGQQEVRSLDTVCRNNGIRIYGDTGHELCCIENAWKQMVQGKIQKS